jgi:phosphate transport system substrate-binding protein
MLLNPRIQRSSQFAMLFATVGLAACTSPTATETASAPESPAAQTLSGTVVTDGSSTVFPITEAMAEEFQRANPTVQVTVGSSGTGGGFEKFCSGETAINNASRPIEADEKEKCRQAGIEFIELPVAFDALTVVVHPENTWAQCLTTGELKRIWAPAAQGRITNWNQIRSDFPDQPLTLFGPGTDSGTFDYFTEAIVGEEGASRGDFTASEDDNVLVQGVAGNPNALGYFGLAFYEANQERLKSVTIDDGNAANGTECIAPSAETVLDGTYQPLARPLFLYVNAEKAKDPEVKAFVDFALNSDNQKFVSETGYVPMSEAVYNKVQTRFTSGKTGSVFQGAEVGVNVKELLQKQ